MNSGEVTILADDIRKANTRDETTQFLYFFPCQHFCRLSLLPPPKVVKFFLPKLPEREGKKNLAKLDFPLLSSSPLQLKTPRNKVPLFLSQQLQLFPARNPVLGKLWQETFQTSLLLHVRKLSWLEVLETKATEKKKRDCFHLSSSEIEGKSLNIHVERPLKSKVSLHRAGVLAEREKKEKVQ